MNKVLTIVCFLFCTHLTVGQEKQLTSDSDTEFEYSFYYTLGSKVQAETIKNINKDLF